MQAGRIISYSHSDKTSPNKAGAMVKVLSNTDFGSKTDEFLEFCNLLAKYAAGMQSTNFEELCITFPNLLEKKVEVEKVLKEKITVEQIYVMSL